MSLSSPAQNDEKRPLSGAPARNSTLRSYYELTRMHKFPAGSILVFWPTAWGLAMAAYRVGTPWRDLAVQMVGWFIGATLLHSTECVINDILDRDLDRQVERSKSRPIASGAISVHGATMLLFIMTAACIWMLSLTNHLAFMVGLIGLFPLDGLYPLMKRWTNWPQAWLGIAVNWGLPTAWIAVTGSFDWELLAVALFSTWCWTFVYDTIYGCQDRKDDVKAGVKSAAVMFGDCVRPILSIFAVLVVVSLACVGYLNGQSIWFYVISVGGAAFHFAWQLSTIDFENGDDCWQKFCSNSDVGAIVLGGMLVDCYLKVVA